MSETKPTRLRAGERRDDIVRAVLELAKSGSPDGITTQRIAAAIGLTQGAVFRHFASRDEIFSAVLAWFGQELGRRQEAAARGPGDALERLRQVFLAQAEAIADHPGAPRIVFNELQRPEESALRQQVRGLLGGVRSRYASLLREAASQGLTVPGLDEDAAALMLAGMVQGLVMQSAILHHPGRLRDSALALFPLFLDGVRGGGK